MCFTQDTCVLVSCAATCVSVEALVLQRVSLSKQRVSLSKLQVDRHTNVQVEGSEGGREGGREGECLCLSVLS